MKRCLLWIVGCLVSTQLLAAAPAKPGFRAGAATSNITPFLGGGVIGGFVPFPATNVHDELHARCLVLDDGQTKLALVVCDLLGVSQRREHRGPQADPGERGNPARARADLRRAHPLGVQCAGQSAPLDEYQTFVARRIADGVQAAARHAAAGPDGVCDRRGAGARLQSPLVDEARHGPAQSVRRHRPGEDESARRQPQPGRAGRPDRPDRLDPRLARAGRPADRRLLGLLAALRGRREGRRHLGRLLRHVLPRAGAVARRRATRTRPSWP